jgi:hypothetical protein
VKEAQTHTHYCQGLSYVVPAVPLAALQNLSCLVVPRANVLVGAALVLPTAADPLLQPVSACLVRGSEWYAAVATQAPLVPLKQPWQQSKLLR